MIMLFDLGVGGGALDACWPSLVMVAFVDGNLSVLAFSKSACSISFDLISCHTASLIVSFDVGRLSTSTESRLNSTVVCAPGIVDHLAVLVSLSNGPNINITSASLLYSVVFGNLALQLSLASSITPLPEA